MMSAIVMCQRKSVGGRGATILACAVQGLTNAADITIQNALQQALQELTATTGDFPSHQPLVRPVSKSS